MSTSTEVREQTPNQVEAQAVKRRRRYADSVGKGYCQLYSKGHMCPDLSVRHVGDLWICSHHSDLLDEIVLGARKRRRVAA